MGSNPTSSVSFTLIPMLALKDAIAQNHRTAEQMPVMQAMLRGELSVDQYSLYLHQMFKICAILEQHPLPHPSLNRRGAIADDLRELDSEPYTLETTQHYINYLQMLTDTERLPHIYLHYMALLFGGQLTQTKVPGTGRMYKFEDMRECVTAIRTLQVDTWAEEVNKGFIYFMDILDELQHLFKLSRPAISDADHG